MPSRFISNAQGTDTSEVPRQIQETVCALHWWSNSWPRERTLWREGRRQMYNLESFDCSWHEFQRFLLSCTRTRLVPKQNDQDPNVFSCKYAFNKGKLNHLSVRWVFLTSNVKISLNLSIQLRDFGLKRHSSLFNDNTSSYNTCSYYLWSFIKSFKQFNRLFLGFLFLEPRPVKTPPLAQQVWSTNEEGEEKMLLTSGPGYIHRTTERLSYAFQNTPFFLTTFSIIFQVRWTQKNKL